jgi:hydroxymethylbilane synthase
MTDAVTLHPIRIATRGSALALTQAESVWARCRAAFPNQVFKITTINTTGDRQQTASLAGSDLPKGLFTKEIEIALLRGEVDLAVHSLKDLPTDLPEGLILGAVSERVDVRDVLVWRRASTAGTEAPPVASRQSAGVSPKPPSMPAQPLLIGLATLPTGSTVATSSTRRAAQLREHRPDLRIVPIRGNLGTRLRKLAAQPDWDATVLAAAGLARLQYWMEPDGRLRGPEAPEGLLATPLSLDEMLPCVGQAALGLEIRENDPMLTVFCEKLDHYETHQCVTAERAFLRALGGGCHLAVAAYAEARENLLHMRAVSFLEDQARHTAGEDVLENADDLGRRLAQAVRS